MNGLTDEEQAEYDHLRDDLGVDVLDHLAFDVQDMDVDGDSSPEAVNAFMTQYLWSMKKNGHRMVAPAQVYSDAPHAEYIEYGTGPARRQSLPPKGQQGSLFDILTRWADVRLAGKFSSSSQRDAFVQKLCKRIYRQGIAPQPYFRAAVYQTLDEDMRTGQFKDGDVSLLDIAQKIAQHARQNIRDNDTLYNHALVSSIKVDDLSASASLENGQVTVNDTGATEVGDGSALMDELWKRENRETGIPDRYGAYKKPRRRR